MYAVDRVEEGKRGEGGKRATLWMENRSEENLLADLAVFRVAFLLLLLQ